MKKSKIGIYCIKNIENNKQYIGSSVNIISRWYGHKTKLRYNKHENKYLQRSWNKYGENAFIFEIIEETNKEDMKEKESYYIQLYKTLDRNDGYNMCKDPFHSRLGLTNSETHNRRIGKANKGRKFSQDIIEANRLRNIGRKHTEETIKKMSETHKKHIPTESQLKNLLWNKTPVVQLDYNKNIINEFNTITNAIKKTGINNISAVCRGIQKTAGGYVWMYKDEAKKG
jgi:group I intron endonuclease